MLTTASTAHKHHTTSGIESTIFFDLLYNISLQIHSFFFCFANNSSAINNFIKIVIMPCVFICYSPHRIVRVQASDFSNCTVCPQNGQDSNSGSLLIIVTFLFGILFCLKIPCLENFFTKCFVRRNVNIFAFLYIQALLPWAKLIFI